MTLREGQKVSYIGESPNVGIGDVGKVIAAQGGVTHVMWETGLKTGGVTAEHDEDLVATSARETTSSQLADSLDDGDLVTVAVRETYDNSGDVGLLNALASAGHLGTLSSYAEEALALVASRIRTDPSFRAVLAELDPEEGDSLVNLAAIVLVRDAFSQDA